jgi:hypothetical protein
MLAVGTVEGRLIGSVSWFTVQHCPSAACQALNVGISLFSEYRGRGYGARALRLQRLSLCHPADLMPTVQPASLE